ncbi:cystathionine gamma-synthase family protein [Ammoniphilus sp. 3BR4]|uniref:cystathionine gamma-synthase family protein n=1 Tax=Ammoniphilus sp. 3BR4 TaxID=3158265 RepID=UPI003467C520
MIVSKDFNNANLGTKTVWAGEEEFLVYGATQVPVVFSVAYGYDDVDHWHDVNIGVKKGYIYSRCTNPTVQAFENKIKILEMAEEATSFSTGMAAISNTLYTFLRSGDRIVSIKDTYGGTNKIFTEFLPQLGVEVVLTDTECPKAMEAEVAKGCKILYLETPTNPTVKVTDIQRLANAAHEAGALVVVDNTFATPINQNPLALGADLVIHSATKFLGGHGDALGGVVCGAKELVQKIEHYREINGAAMDPFAAYLILRGMKTLKLRVLQQAKSAMDIANFLYKQRWVDTVHYPGLETHPNHELAKKQMRGFGGILSFSLKGGMDAVRVFLPRLQFANRAANLGAVETTYGPACTTSHAECTPEERAAMGIPDSLIRISVGIEDTQDLIADLEQSFRYLDQHF